MAQLRMRKLRTPSDFASQAAGTQESIMRTRARETELRELSASQAGRIGEYGSLAESYRAKAKEAKSVREFEEKDRIRQEKEWSDDDRRRDIDRAVEVATAVSKGSRDIMAIFDRVAETKGDLAALDVVQ